MNRRKVGVERTILCAIRFWSVDRHVGGGGRGQATTPTLARGVKLVVRKQGYTTAQINKAIRKLQRGGFLVTGPSRIALTPKGGRVGCSTVRLAPWTDAQYPGSTLRGLKRRRR